MEQAKQIEEKRVNTILGFRGNVVIRTTIPSEPNNSIEVVENTSSSERLTRKEMLDSLRELQDRNADKAMISLKDLKEARAKEPDRFPRESEIYREFKSFNHAKELAGVSVSRQGRRTVADRWTKRELLNYLKEIATRLGRLPTVNDLVELRKEDPSLPSHQMIAHPFRGSLEVALKEAGLIKSARKPAWKTLKRYGGEEGLLDHLRSLHQTLGRTPTADDVINARKNENELEKVPVDLNADTTGEFSVTVSLSDGSEVTIEGTIGPDGMIVDARLSGSDKNGVPIRSDSEDGPSTDSAGNPKSSLSIKQVDVGSNHGCVVMDDDSAWCWGSNDSGQLGNSQHNDTEGLVKVNLPVGVKSIVAGFDYTYAVTDNGRLYVWGKGVETPQLVNSVLHVDHIFTSKLEGETNLSCVISVDGQLNCWKEQADSIEINPTDIMSNVKDVVIDGDEGFILKYDGSVYRLDSHANLIAAQEIYKETNKTKYGLATHIIIYSGIPCLLMSDGTLEAFNFLGGGFVAQDSETNLHSLDIVGDYILRLSRDQQVRINSGAWVDGNILSNVTDIAMGYSSACAVESAKTLKCWSSLDPDAEIAPYTIGFE